MGGSWEAMCWIVVGLAMFSEMASQVVIRGTSSFCRDWWCIFDSVVIVLTVLAWTLTLMRRLSGVAEEAVEDTDLPLLALRFLLQPCRVVVTASMTSHVQDMQQSNLDIDLEGLSIEDGHVRCEGAPQTRDIVIGTKDSCGRRDRHPRISAARQCARRLRSRVSSRPWFRRYDESLGARKKGETV